MEYTKDMIFNVKYNKESDCLEIEDKSFTGKLHNFVKRNKAISVISLISFGLIIWDFALIANFISLLNKL